MSVHCFPEAPKEGEFPEGVSREAGGAKQSPSSWRAHPCFLGSGTIPGAKLGGGGTLFCFLSALGSCEGFGHGRTRSVVDGGMRVRLRTMGEA